MMISTNLSRFLTRVKGTLLLLVAFFATTGLHAQTTNDEVKKTFTACALNVDGLPSTINSDGPGNEGTTQIGQYIAKSNIDIAGISEDFNYHSELSAAVSDTYYMGSYRGGIDIGIEALFNPHFNTDGLMFLMKKTTGTFSNESYVKWNDNLGGLTSGANENISKGFRFYTIDLGDYVKIDVYILHMNTAENAEQIAVQDKQLTQLANAILANGDGRPKLIIGDTNCRYTRNKVTDNLINPLKDKYKVVSDVWVEKCKDGIAPLYGTSDLMISDKTNASEYQTKEIVDKIIYLVPKGCSLNMTCKEMRFEVDGYKKDDKTLLGDHVPVIATFEISGTPIEDDYAPGAQENFWVGETFETIKNNYGSEAYLCNVGAKTFITTEDKAEVKDIQGAKVVKWKFTPSGSDYTITSGDYFLQMNATEKKILLVTYYIEDTGVRTGSGMPLTVSESSPMSGVYKFSKYGQFSAGSKSTRYFNVDGTNYSNAETLGVLNDWLLISEDQKQAYLNYVAAYNKANEVRKNINDYPWVKADDPELYDELLQTLLETKNTNYNNVTENIKELNDIVDAIRNRKGYDVVITSANKSGDWYYATLCLPWNAWVPEGVSTFTGSFKEDKDDTRYITMNEYAKKQSNGNTVIPAGIGGYILKTNAEGTYRFYRTGKPADAPATSNYLNGNPSMENVMPTDSETGKVYVLANKNKGLGFYILAANNPIRHNCAYIVLEKEKVTKIKYVSFLFDDISTAIDKAETETGVKATAVYGVAGEQRSAMRRGINIVRMSDGTVRKVAVK